MTYKDLFKKKPSDTEVHPTPKPANVNGQTEDAPGAAPEIKPATKH